MNLFQTASRERRFEAARERNPVLFDRIMSILNVTTPEACWNTTQSTDGCGYGQIRVNGPKKKIHKLVFSLFYPDVEHKVVRHMCNNPACANPAHLRGGTQKDNAMDRKLSGREGNHKGTANGRAKITEADVLEIRSSLLSVKQLAEQYGVSRTVIYYIKKRQSWKHI